MELMTGAWIHRDPHEREQCRARKPGCDSHQCLPHGANSTRASFEVTNRRALTTSLAGLISCPFVRIALNVLICSAMARSAGKRSTELAP